VNIHNTEQNFEVLSWLEARKKLPKKAQGMYKNKNQNKGTA
jgi:hypothetical protein